MEKLSKKSDLAGLSLLGSGEKAKPVRKLETFPNHSKRPIPSLSPQEFTCLCPMTGQPDFAGITIQYIPDRKIVESKSLKLYFWSFRNEGVFHEHLTNIILDDLVAALSPAGAR